ncbi:hypothetical protein [Caloranaerobacter ferrireducens]|uniref:hypothetical protein n=1 Tax=Caloranaerobacter ferrireducens TaxID=1323370 RepID=UPI00084D3114|nr:hypothetical protein [Caloranaerobacter ferrireducens]
MSKRYLKLSIGMVLFLLLAYFTCLSERAIKSNVLNQRGYKYDIYEKNEGFKFTLKKEWITKLLESEEKKYKVDVYVYEDQGSKIKLESLYSKSIGFISLVFKIEPKYNMISGEIPLVNDIKYLDGDISYTSIKFKIDYEDDEGNVIEGIGRWTFTGENKWFVISMEEKNLPKEELLDLRVYPLKILKYRLDI